ncbi:hypothetical protein ACFWNE_28785 [Streptomyces goshikiensis]|uniref:hypothetical protein n=1 Tax=Streptomyces goshikiensis TaxID=1942 RepID=UPI003662C941
MLPVAGVFRLPSSRSDHTTALHHEVTQRAEFGEDRAGTAAPLLHSSRQGHHQSADLYGWYVRLREKDGTFVGRAVVSQLVEGTAVLEWITLTPRPDGTSHILLQQCPAHVADRGVRELTLVLDTPADHADHSWGPVRDLDQQAGFHEIDQLHPYTRRP